MKHVLRILVAASGMSLGLSTPTVAASEEETVSNAYLHLDGAMDEWASAPALQTYKKVQNGLDPPEGQEYIQKQLTRKYHIDDKFHFVEYIQRGNLYNLALQ